MTEQSPGALAGIRVIDLTRVLGGPYCTQVLGDNGADVVKIEPPQGDETRDWGPPFDGDDASYFVGVNRNKRAMALDLGREEGRAVLLRLLEQADVLIENYKPGAMEAWGLGYEAVLKVRFPRLIHCRISGFGSSGPLGGLPGYDAAIQALTGMFSVNGTPEAGATRVGIPLVDIGTGLYSAIAILMALVERASSGLGQYLDMTLYDCGLSLMHPHIPNFLVGGTVPGLTGNAHPNIAPYDKFPTRTGDIFLAVGNDRAFLRLCTELGRPELAEDPRFLHNRDRQANKPVLRDILAELLLERDGEALSARLLEIGVPAGAVHNTEQVLAHPHTAHRGMLIETDGYRGWGDPIKMSRTPSATRRRPPRFAQHGREILAEFGFGDEEVEALAEMGVLVETRRK